MKPILIVLALFFSTLMFAQEGVKVSGNTVTVREVAPVWPGCTGSEFKKKNCFNQNLAQHVAKNFKFPKDWTQQDKGTKVIVSFIINTEGNPEIVKVTGGRASFQDEAKRNILLLPQMEPGRLGNKKKAISYKVPFKF